MKRFGNLIPKVAEYENLVQAFYLAQRGKQGRNDVIDFRENLDARLLMLKEQLLTGNVKIGPYHMFEIFDPKRRVICASPFPDRVMQHALMIVCEPFFERQLITDSFATRKGKGQFKAIDRARHFMASFKYVAKLDVRKYFDSINHERLFVLLSRLFKDSRLLHIFRQIIDSYESQPGSGLPIGNLTSQFFANFYLSNLDHYAKEVLGVQGYIRYMDDVLLFGDSKMEVQTAVKSYAEFANTDLLLTLKPPIFAHTSSGVSFLGFKISSHRILLNSRSKRRFRDKLGKYTELLKRKIWSDSDYRRHIDPLVAFTQHAYTKRFRAKILRQVEGRQSRLLSR